MARGSKDYDKKVRTVNKGQSADKKKSAIHAMVESLIKGDSTAAEENLHDYLQMKTREIIIGEGMDMDMDDEDRDEDMVADETDDEDLDDEDMDDVDDDECDDEDEDMGDEDEVVEGFAQPDEGKMSKKVVPQTKVSGGAKAKKHGNAAAHLDDKVKGKAQYKRYPKGKPAETHANVKDDYKTACDKRDKNLGTTD